MYICNVHIHLNNFPQNLDVHTATVSFQMYHNQFSLNVVFVCVWACFLHKTTAICTHIKIVMREELSKPVRVPGYYHLFLLFVSMMKCLLMLKTVGK